MTVRLAVRQPRIQMLTEAVNKAGTNIENKLEHVGGSIKTMFTVGASYVRGEPLGYALTSFGLSVITYGYVSPSLPIPIFVTGGVITTFGARKILDQLEQRQERKTQENISEGMKALARGGN